ncbi:MAG: T9SS type A sorting domain-containing protein [Prevotellaceae bacterium]|jgi:fibro-slime domain-containing protein|nr:T9SS type A sorting domain-containing protein [Prevotellaceae bacterium]
MKKSNFLSAIVVVALYSLSVAQSVQAENNPPRVARAVEPKEMNIGAVDQIMWPEGQLLPSFPAPASMQHLFFLRNTTKDEMYLFSSLKGIVNRTQPRLFSYEGDDFAEGEYTWLNSLKVNYNTAYINNSWGLLTLYKSEVDGLIVYDPNQPHTVNLAIPMTKNRKLLIASPALLNKLTAAPYNFPIVEDLRGKFTSSQQVYQHVFDSCWQTADKRLLIGLSPENHQGSLREYAVALGAVVVWLDPKKSAESTLLNRFLETMPPGANHMGWWPDEQEGITRLSHYGLTTIASDYSTNLTFHSGMPRTINARPMPAKPELKNKIYVAFIISDGDNLQYVEHLMRKLWGNPDRGSVPIGWTVSPAMVDAMPGALNYYHQSATDNDNLISGPSGYGYTYPNNWINASHTNADALAEFVAKTEEYNVKAGLRVITVWNTIVGGISANVGSIFADNAPTLLGVTAQNTGGAQSIYSLKLPGKPLSCNYCTNEQAMKEHIASASNGWDGSAPRFLIIQAQPWNNVRPTSFKEVASSLDKNKYEVVRPDHIFQLIREHNNLTINPGGVEGNGDGLTGAYFNGKDFDVRMAVRTDDCINFEWGGDAPLTNVNKDNFSVRWTGKITPRYSGNTTFYLTSDDGVRLWINNKLIIDKWEENQGRVSTGAISLVAGQKYDVKLEYYEGHSAATCKLEWASPFHSREVVPKSHLFSDAAGSGDDDPVSATAINILGETTIATCGGSLQLTTAASPQNTFYPPVVWSVSDSSIACITEMGKLYAKANGTVSVTATATFKDGSKLVGSKEITLSNQNIGDYSFTVMGSSVPWGQGAEPRDQKGYAWLWTDYLRQNEEHSWTTNNISVGGNTTTDVINRWDRDLLASCSRYVYYGLSLGNEGIHERGKAAFDSWRDNMLALIERTRKHGKIPIVGNNYPRGDFNATDYLYVKQLNLLIHEWDVPSVNLLGAIDDGSGRWVSNYKADDAHPNTAGHAELFHAIVPSLLDAVAEGKPQPVRNSEASLTLTRTDKVRRIALKPEGVLHSFTLTFSFRTTSTGTLASLINANKLTACLKIDADGRLTYETEAQLGKLISTAVLNDGEWHQVSLTHYHAWGKPFVYVDGEPVTGATVSERLTPVQFYLNDLESPLLQVDFRELFLHRSAMSDMEIQALHAGKMLKSSLEIYTPLDGNAATGQEMLENRAQSLNAATIVEDNFTEVAPVGAVLPLRVYPNPAGDNVFVESESPEGGAPIEILNVQGAVVKRVEVKTSGVQSISLSELSAGIYLLRQGEKMVKIVKK